MYVKLMAHTSLSAEYINQHLTEELKERILIPHCEDSVEDGQIVSLVAIRNCYSANNPSEIAMQEGDKYFGNAASDGKRGTDADRLIRQIVASKHVSTLEHLNYTFLIEGVSRALLAQLTRHRHLSYSVKSQRYVKFGSNDKSGGFDYVVPHSVTEDKKVASNDHDDYFVEVSALDIFNEAMEDAQYAYDRLRKAGVPAEDARAVLPNAAATDIVMTGNLRSLLELYTKRKSGKGAQKEIADLAELIKSEIISVDPWLESFFD